MLEQLIEIFERLKKSKEDKFSSCNDPDFIKNRERLLELIEEYKTNVFALCNMEQYIEPHFNNNKKQSYLSMTIDMLRTLGEPIPPEVSEMIWTDNHINEQILDAKTKAEKTILYNQKYEQVQLEIKALDFIINELKKLGPEDYIEAELINKIYEYLSQEFYISYHEKFVDIGGLIISHNIETANKRTLI